MATTYKVLGQAHATSANTDLYTVPSATSAVCSTLAICNLGASATYRVAVRVAGAAIEDKQFVVHDATINADDSALLTLGITLAATDVITVQSSTDDVSFNLFGSELT